MHESSAEHGLLIFLGGQLNCIEYSGISILLFHYFGVVNTLLCEWRFQLYIFMHVHSKLLKKSCRNISLLFVEIGSGAYFFKLAVQKWLICVFLCLVTFITFSDLLPGLLMVTLYVQYPESVLLHFCIQLTWSELDTSLSYTSLMKTSEESFSSRWVLQHYVRSPEF